MNTGGILCSGATGGRGCAVVERAGGEAGFIFVWRAVPPIRIIGRVLKIDGGIL